MTDTRRVIAKVIFLSTCLIFSGCARTIDRFLGDPPPPPEVVTKDNILPLLLSKTVGSCADGSLRFQYLQATGIVLWTDPEAPLTMAEISFFLNSDFTYQAVYSENTRTGMDWTKTHEQRVDGEYVYSGGKLEFSGVGSAQVSLNDNSVGFNLVFGRDLHSANLKNKSIEVRSVSHANGLQTKTEYCAQAAANASNTGI